MSSQSKFGLGLLSILIFLVPLKAVGKDPADEVSPPECTVCPLEGPCPLAIEKWQLSVNAVKDPSAAPPWMSGGRLPVEARLELRNPGKRAIETELMLVSEDGDSAVSFKGISVSLRRLVMPSPPQAGWSRPKLRVSIFSLVLLAGERGELCCTFRQPLEFLESNRSQLVYLPPRSRQWAKLGRGQCDGKLPPALQIGFEDKLFPAQTQPWPFNSKAATFSFPIDPDTLEVRLDVHCVCLSPFWELFCLTFPGALIGSVGALVLPWRKLRARPWACFLAIVIGALFTLGINRLLRDQLGWPDLAYRHDWGTWAEVFGSCTWIASPSVAALSVFFVWPLFRRPAKLTEDSPAGRENGL